MVGISFEASKSEPDVPEAPFHAVSIRLLTRRVCSGWRECGNRGALSPEIKELPLSPLPDALECARVGFLNGAWTLTAPSPSTWSRKDGFRRTCNTESGDIGCPAPNLYGVSVVGAVGVACLVDTVGVDLIFISVGVPCRKPSWYALSLPGVVTAAWRASGVWWVGWGRSEEMAETAWRHSLAHGAR